MATGSSRREDFSAISRQGNFAAVGNGIALAATTTSGSVAFPDLTTNPDGSYVTDVLIFNSGTVPAWIAFGSSSVVAAIPTVGTPANGISIPPGVYTALDKGTASNVAAITASGTATLYFNPGMGS